MLTWLLPQWVIAGSPPDGAVLTTLYQLITAVYGTRAKGTRNRAIVAEARSNLNMAVVTLSDHDIATGADVPGRWVDVHLVTRIHYGEHLQAAHCPTAPRP